MSAQTLGKQLLNSRARVFYSGVPAWISGWVYDAQLPDIWIAASLPLPKETALTVSVQIDMAAAHFEAIVIEVDADESVHRKAPIFVGRGVSIPQPKQYCYKLNIVSGIRQQQNKQANRKALHEMQGSVMMGEAEIPILVGDISAAGAGVYSIEELPVGQLVELICMPDGKAISIQGTVQHSREVPAESTLYASGLRFTRVGRIEAARWKNRFYDAHVVPSRTKHGEASNAQRGDVEIFAQTPEDGKIERLADYIERLVKVSQMERQIIIHNMELLSGSSKETIRAQVEVFARHEDELRDKICEILESLKKEDPFAA